MGSLTSNFIQVVGLATRLCQELEITSEAAIAAASSKTNAVEIDMRRRLFWVITSMEFGLAHILGRPSGFGTGPDDIDVQFFHEVDDQFITESGAKPGSPTSVKKQIAIHFFKMRLHQAEIRRKLFLRKREEPVRVFGASSPPSEEDRITSARTHLSKHPMFTCSPFAITVCSNC